MKTVPEQIEYLDVSTTEDLLMELTTDVLMSYNYLGTQHETIIPKGFRTDYGSVPKSVHWLISNTGIYNEAYLLHDWSYSKDYVGPDISRKDADTLLWLNLIDAGMEMWKANIVFTAVDMFADEYWKT